MKSERPSAPPNAQAVAFSAGHLEHAVEPAVGRVAAQGETSPEGEPDGAVIVDREPVGHSRVLLDRGERASVGRRSGREVVVEDVDPLRERVDVVQEPRIRRPGEAVRERDAVEDRSSAPPVKR